MPENNENQNNGGTNAGQSQSGTGQSGTGTGQGGQQQGQGQSTQGNDQGGTQQGGGQSTQTGANGQQGGDSGTGAGGGSTEAGGTVVKAAGAAQAGTETQAAPATPDWPTDWRNKLAGPDDKDGKVLKQLERFASPGDLLRSYNELQTKINSGQLKAPLGKDATPEQIAAYRKENGVPEAAEKYDLTLKDGMVVGEQDKPIVDSLLGVMHKHNLSQDAVSDILGAYYQQEKAFLTGAEKEIGDNKIKTDDVLHKEWGEEYRSEVNRIENLLNTFSPEAQAAIQYGKDDKGMPLLNNVHFLRDMAVQARIINPVSTVVGGGGTNQMSSVETEITALEGMMGDRQSAYWKGDQAEKNQARYRELIDWRERQKTGGKAA